MSHKVGDLAVDNINDKFESIGVWKDFSHPSFGVLWQAFSKCYDGCYTGINHVEASKELLTIASEVLKEE